MASRKPRSSHRKRSRKKVLSWKALVMRVARSKDEALELEREARRLLPKVKKDLLPRVMKLIKERARMPKRSVKAAKRK
jgi:hypothetical protein